MLRCSLSRRFGARFAIDNDTISVSADNSLAYTSGAWPLVARARAPVCPSLATPLILAPMIEKLNTNQAAN